MSSGSYYSKGGFDYQFSGNVDEFLCLLCYKVMRDPTQISCGHVYCRTCLHYHLQTYANCPSCRQMIDPSSIFSDASMRNRIYALEIRCPNSRCDWHGSTSNVESHLQNCAFRQARLNRKCEFCGESIDTLRISQHKKICPGQRCATCNEPFVHGEAHLCPGDKIMCMHNCGAILPRADMPSHQDPKMFNCPNMSRNCPYEKCPQTGLLVPSALNHHISNNPIQHALYYKEQVESLSERIGIISTRQDKLEHENTALKKEISAVQQSHYTTKMKLSCYIRKKAPPLPDESWDDFLAEVTIPTNGVLIWEIPNFKILFNSANRLTKIYSQPFYTTPAGFKLCCYAQKEDDQVIRVTIQRMEGKFDGILGNLQVQSVQISILNFNRHQNLSFTAQHGQIVEDCTSPIELSSLQSILGFLGDSSSSSAFLEVTVISSNFPST